MEKMATWEIALRRSEMPVSRFLSFMWVEPLLQASFVVALIAIFLTGGFSDGALFAGFAGAFLLFIMPAMAGLAAASFPILEVNQALVSKSKKKCICSSQEWVFFLWVKLGQVRFSIF